MSEFYPRLFHLVGFSGSECSFKFIILWLKYTVAETNKIANQFNWKDHLQCGWKSSELKVPQGYFLVIEAGGREGVHRSYVFTSSLFESAVHLVLQNAVQIVVIGCDV